MGLVKNIKSKMDETISMFILSKHHESTRQAVERVWVKHLLKDKGILNKSNYNQPQMNTFYNAVAANYAYLHRTYPQTFKAHQAFDRETLGLPKDREITHADLYLHRAIEKARTVEFREILNGPSLGRTFDTGIMVDDKKIERAAPEIAHQFFKSQQYLTDPNCPKSFANIVQNSTQGLNGMLGFILQSKESRESFISDPKGFMDQIINNGPLTAEQQQSYYAMQSPAFVEVIASNEEYIAAAIQQKVQEEIDLTTSHKTYHLGLLYAPSWITKEPLADSYKHANEVASRSRTETERANKISQEPLAKQVEIMSSTRATEEMFTELLTSRTLESKTSTNFVRDHDKGVVYIANTLTSSGYTINEPNFTLLEHMMIADNHPTAIPDFFSYLYDENGEIEFLEHPIFSSPKSAFNIVSKDGKVNLPSQFKSTVQNPQAFSMMSPAKTYFALTNNILESKMISQEQGTKVDSYAMVQQTQSMLLQSFQNTRIEELYETMQNMIINGAGKEDLLQLLGQVSSMELVAQHMFTDLVLSMDINMSQQDAKDMLTQVFGKDATLTSVLQEPKTLEEVQFLVDSGIILPTENVQAYVTMLTSTQEMRGTLETTLSTSNPNLTDAQWTTLVDTITPKEYQQIQEIAGIVTGVQDNVIVEDDIVEASTISIDASALHTPLSEDITATVETEILSSSTSTESATSDMSAGVADAAADVGGCDMGGDCPSE